MVITEIGAYALGAAHLLIAAGLDGELLTTPEPQIVGALGAALNESRDVV